ncbi:MAG TPA: 4-hydroxy-tetrahydrodipicolinate synthase [Stellaceae bacterium]|nr:4-hydroxy-tetrahydrodipicolinate synthase [Stellaceae bacterium]
MTTTAQRRVAALAGYVSALPTPFRGERIDHESFADLCEWQIGQGISGFVVNGTTGEAPALAIGEQRLLIRLAVQIADDRVPVIAGAGSASTAHAIELAKSAASASADGILATTPYYVRPSQEGIYRHFRALHDAVELPIILYDVPSRTASTIAKDTLCRLAELSRIAGLKDATGDLSRIKLLREKIDRRFRWLSGDDATALDFMALGGHGCISVLSNVVPRRCVELYQAHSRGDLHRARAVARELAPLTAALFAESNPVPVKYALGVMGRMVGDVRLPLAPASQGTRKAVEDALANLGLLTLRARKERAHDALPLSQ